VFLVIKVTTPISYIGYKANRSLLLRLKRRTFVVVVLLIAEIIIRLLLFMYIFVY